MFRREGKEIKSVTTNYAPPNNGHNWIRQSFSIEGIEAYYCDKCKHLILGDRDIFSPLSKEDLENLTCNEIILKNIL